MSSKRNSISKDKLKEVCTSLNEKEFRKNEDKIWINKFNNTPLVVRREIIKLMGIEQTKSIIKGIHQMEDIITIPYLGKFIIKKFRKEYINHRRDNPDISVEETVKHIKEKYNLYLKERQLSKLKKNKKLNLIQVKNENSSSS